MRLILQFVAFGLLPTCAYILVQTALFSKILANDGCKKTPNKEGRDLHASHRVRVSRRQYNDSFQITMLNDTVLFFGKRFT